MHTDRQGRNAVTEDMQKYDTNGNGKLDPEELVVIEVEDRRRRMLDDDAQRDAIRKMAWFALFGLLLYPLGIFVTSMFGLETAAQLIADIAPTYFASIAVLVSAFFGADALKGKKES
jgi:FtsH-binding integral membrane protein